MYRLVKETRIVFDVEIIDGSKCSDKVRKMPLAVFCNQPRLGKEPEMWQLLKEVSESGAAQPVSFLKQ